MTPNPFDQACRYLIKKYAGILGWLLGALPAAVRFAGWLDTRSIPFPGEPDRVCDTVAHLVDTTGPERHWAVPIEFQLKPISRMFGRLLEYLARLWLTLASHDGSGQRWCVGAVLVNLTGRGDSSQRMEMAAVGMRLVLDVPEKNLAEEDATAALDHA
jgi:hypothetical protein